MKKRKSNIELLRIMCMLFILTGHIIGENNLLSIDFGLNWGIYRFLSNGGRIAVNCFIIIGAYFLVDLNFDFKRVLRIWLEVFFYNFVFTGLLIIMGHPIGIKRIIQVFIPIFGEPLWFASVYMGLLLISPFLNKILKECSELFVKKLLLIMFIAFSVSSTFIPTSDVYYSNIGWFIFIYMFIGYYKKYMLHGNESYKKFFSRSSWWYFSWAGIIFVLLYAFAVICKILAVKEYSYSNILFSIGEYYGYHLQTIPSFLCAFFCFLGFEKINMKESKIINIIASATFGVYIIHQVPAFYPYLWKWLKVYDIGVKEWGILYIILCILFIYIMCTVIDLIRQKVIEKNVLKSNKVCMLCTKVNEWYKFE